MGEYTSAAVASIAFNQPCAAVDGNVVRVISRLRALGGDPKKLGKDHQRLASEILDVKSPGDFNQVIKFVCMKEPNQTLLHGCLKKLPLRPRGLLYYGW